MFKVVLTLLLADKVKEVPLPCPGSCPKKYSPFIKFCPDAEKNSPSAKNTQLMKYFFMPN
jgi:hypothetical protein